MCSILKMDKERWIERGQIKAIFKKYELYVQLRSTDTDIDTDTGNLKKMDTDTEKKKFN